MSEHVRLSLRIPEDAKLVKPRREERELPKPIEAAMGFDRQLLKIGIDLFPHSSRKVRQWATNLAGYWNSAPWPESG